MTIENVLGCACTPAPPAPTRF